MVSSDVLPTCFVLTVGVEDTEYGNFCARFSELEKKNFLRERLPAKHCQDNWWLIKPANLNQGRGIKIFNNIKEIGAFLAQQQAHSLWVAQKYLERPLLYKDRKFDIRMWMLVTANYEIYYYKKSYVRTSSSTYVLNDTQDYLTHLTNNCFQIQSDSYGKHEDGNIISLTALQDFIREAKEPSYSLDEHFFPWAVTYCTDVILSGQKKMKRVPTSYELFGFDLMIDEDLRVWLIECNVNPHLGMPNELMKKTVPAMLNEMFTIVLDPVVPPKEVPPLETGNWIPCYSTAMKHSREHIATKTFYPFKQFAVPRQALEKKKADRRTENEGSIEDKILKKNVSLRAGVHLPVTGKKFKAYAIDNITELITKQMSVSAVDDFQLAKNVDRVFACISNWELYSDEQVKSAVKAVHSVLDSPFDYLVATPDHVSVLLAILQAEEVKLELMLELLELLALIPKRKKLASRLTANIVEMVDVLTRALYCFLRGEDSQLYPVSLAVKVFNTIQGLCEDNDRQVYVPGSSNERDLVAMEVLFAGGLVSLVAARKFLRDKDPIEALEQFLDNLSVDDLALQVDILDQRVDCYTPQGHLNGDHIVQLPSFKQMNKRLQKVVERAIVIVNKQITTVTEMAGKSGDKPEGYKPGDDPSTKETGSNSMSIAGTPRNTTSPTKGLDSPKEKTGSKTDLLFFGEWLAQVDLNWLREEFTSRRDKKMEERERQKAREIRKIEL